MASYETSAELRHAVEAAETEAGAKLAKLGKLSACARMKLLFDEGTFVETGKYIGRKTTEFDSGDDDSTASTDKADSKTLPKAELKDAPKVESKDTPDSKEK